MGKRGRNLNGAGNIYQRSDGRWRTRVTLPDGHSKDYYSRTKQEARVKLTEALRSLDTGAPIVRDERLTMRHYLDDWLERKRPSVKPLTWVRYQGLLKHIIRAYGDKQLTKLSAAQLERLYAELMAPTHGGKRLASTTVHHIHTVLHQALADAERLGLVARNAAARRSGAKPPRVRQVDMHTLDLEQARMLLAALRQHKARQAEEKLASGLGKAWGDARWPDLVFTDEIGHCLDASNLLKRRFHPLLRRAELPVIRFHDLRHTAATLMLLRGVSAKVVSERLGHSSVAFTMDRYAHVLPSMQRDAALALGKALFGA